MQGGKLRVKMMRNKKIRRNKKRKNKRRSRKDKSNKGQSRIKVEPLIEKKRLLHLDQEEEEQTERPETSVI